MKLKGKETLLVGSFYRSPNSTTENNDNLNELLEKISEKTISHVLLLGDFNYPKIDWKIMCTSVPSIEDKEFKFIEKFGDCYLIQHITEPTRGRGTTEPSFLKLVITSEDSEIVSIETASALGKSDHSIIKVILNCTPIHEPIRKTFHKYDKGDYPKMEDMLSIDWDAEFLEHEGDVQAQWDIFTMKLREAVERCIPKKVMSERTKKYPIPLNVKIRAKIRRKNRLWKKYLLTRDVQAYQEYCRLRNQVRRLTRKAPKIYEKSIISEIKENPKKFWQYTQAKMKTRMGILNLIKSDSKDDLTNSDSEKAELLADYFSSVFTREPQENTPEEPIRCYNTVETCTINPSVVAAKLKKLKTFKSPGPDGIHPRVLNELADCIIIHYQLFLTHL